jgi:hypothetical protein
LQRNVSICIKHQVFAANSKVSVNQQIPSSLFEGSWYNTRDDAEN